MTKDTRTFNVLLVGNSGVGKTAFLHRYLKKRFEHSPPVTANVEKHDVLLHTTVGPVRYEIWDVSGKQKPTVLASREFDDIDAAIIMFDLTDRVSYNNVPNWYKSLVNKDGMRLGRYIPICICGNKNDASMDAKLPPNAITFPKNKGTGYVEMSVMVLDNVHEPFLDLARQLLKDPTVWYKPRPDIGPIVLEFPTVRHQWSHQDNRSQYPKHEFGPRVLTKEISPLASPPVIAADISAERPPAVIELPKKADASNGQLKFISSTNRVPNGLKSPVNGTISVLSETEPAVKGTAPVAKAEQTELHIVPTETHEPTREHHGSRNEHRESNNTLESLEKQPTPLKDESLFVLCIHCIRMVLIKCIQGTPLAQLSNDNPSFALITTACRACRHDSQKSQSDEVRMSPDLIRYTAMYECARKVAEDEVEVLTNKKSVAHISLDNLTDSIGRECQIQGISTSSDTLQRLRQIPRKDVLLGYQRSLIQRPLLTQSLTTACLFAVGDSLAQQAVEKRGIAQHDVARTGRMAFYGGGNVQPFPYKLPLLTVVAVFGPLATKWFQVLQRRINLPSAQRTVVGRVAADQLLFAPTMIGVFLSSMSVLEGGSLSEKLERSYWPALKANWTVWPFLQLVNFALVPLQFRVLTVNVLNIGWNCFLSLLNNVGSQDVPLVA
ncbi:hypothetical protein KXX54_004443 [Aspergillus fumigatus]|nr:hypothetical protein KXX54_004443 [Aspergillus fumigatus]KAH2248757.1 hypothetical protein KXW72_005947 [Aspergillus fumigatus]KAH3235611.1 hypothetical protein KXV30_007813 [Aspergillus fumigatus]